jgi:hypothetical protein
MLIHGAGRVWMLATVICGFVIACFVNLDGRTSAEPDLRDGDLIFQELQSRQSAAIFAATGSRLTHMGIIRRRNGTVIVVEASATVRETPLSEWIARGRGGRYAVYRVRELSPGDAADILRFAERYYGRPYDLLFRPGDEALYCSELPHLVFKRIGIDLGRQQPLSDLRMDSGAAAALLAERWRRHPDCGGLPDDAACWTAIQHQLIVTPASIAADPDLTMVRSMP